MTQGEEAMSPTGKSSQYSLKGTKQMQQRALITAGFGSVHGNNNIQIINSDDRQIASSTLKKGKNEAIDIRIHAYHHQIKPRDDSIEIDCKFSCC